MTSLWWLLFSSCCLTLISSKHIVHSTTHGLSRSAKSTSSASAAQTHSYDIDDEYIIVFKQDITNQTKLAHFEDLYSEGLPAHNLTHQFQFHNFNGYAAKFDENILKKANESDLIEYIEKVELIGLHDTGYPTDWDENCVVQINPPSWGLTRINKRELENVDGMIMIQITFRIINPF